MTETLKSDIRLLKTSVDEFESYLLSTDVIRQLPNITFSAGSILLAQYRLKAAKMDDSVVEDWNSLENIRTHWKVAWNEKCQSEMKMRLRQRGDFVLGMSSDKHESSTAYRHQVRVRVMLQLLEDNIPDVAESFQASIKRKDTILHKYSIENEFVWEDVVISGFPRDKYWYLYRTMKYEKE